MSRPAVTSLGSAAGVLATLALGVAAGAMLAEGAVLVPWWRSMPPEAFLRWYADNARRLFEFFGPLEIVSEGAERVHNIVAALLNLARGSDTHQIVDVRHRDHGAEPEPGAVGQRGPRVRGEVVHLDGHEVPVGLHVRGELELELGRTRGGDVDRLAQPLVAAAVRARRHVLRAAERAERRRARAEPVRRLPRIPEQRVLRRVEDGARHDERRGVVLVAGTCVVEAERETRERAARAAGEVERRAVLVERVARRGADVRPQVVLEEVVVVRDAAVGEPGIVLVELRLRR